jgi:Tfp pilus assembly protein PilO
MNKSQQLTQTLLDFYRKPVAQVSLELFFSVIAVIFFTIFAIQPTLVTMSDLVKELDEKREVDQQLSQKIAALSTAQTTYLQVVNQIPLLYQSLPLRPKLAESLLLIEKTASDRLLVIDNISVRQVPPEVDADLSQSSSKRSTLPVIVSMTGSYPDISLFLQDLTNLRRLFTIESVTFNRTDDRGNDGLNINITLGLPFYSQESSTTSTDSERATANPAVLDNVEL